MAATKEDAHWQIQEAKQRFSELIRSVQSEGPQFVTKHGEEIAVVIDIEEYHRLHPASRPETFKEWLMNGPKLDDDEFVDMLNDRQRDYTTEEDLNIFDDVD